MVKDQLIGVDEVKITIVMDNTIDVLMAGETNVQRFETCSLGAIDGLSPLVAEHGFCAMIQIRSGDKQKSVLLDAGVSPQGILHNMETLNIDINDMEAIILSHGHADHTLGLPGLIEKIGPKKLPLIAHPDAFL